MFDVHATLEALGLTEKERAIYLALLSLGPTSVRDLAEHTQINRGTVHDVLTALKDRGLVTFYNTSSKRLFVAEDPVRIKTLVAQRRSELDELAQSVDALLPQLRSQHAAGDDKPVARYYEGPNGVRTILLDVLETLEGAERPEYYVYSSAPVREAGFYEAFRDYTQERIARGIEVRTISLGAGGSTVGLDDRRWMDVQEGAPTYILLYGGKCAYISLRENGMLVGVVIEDDGLYETQVLLFQQLWKSLERT